MFNLMNKNKGYSLLETIIYVSLFSLLSIAVLSTIDFSSQAFRSARINNNLSQFGNLAMEKMNKTIKNGSSITVNSVFGTSPGVLEVLDVSGTNTRFYVDSGTLQLLQGGINQGAVLNTGINVESLVFRNITTGRGRAIKIELSLRHVDSGRIENFQTTAILKNSY